MDTVISSLYAEIFNLMCGQQVQGQYTYKVYRVDTKIPSLIRNIVMPIFGEDICEFHEEAWNNYPYCKTVISNPSFEGFKVVIESVHIGGDRGLTPNALGWKNDEVEILNIFK